MKRKLNKLKSASSIILAEGELALDLQKQAEDLEETMEIQIKSRKNSSIILEQEILSVYGRDFGGEPNDNLLKTFFEAINPVKSDEWKKAGKFSRVLTVLKVKRTKNVCSQKSKKFHRCKVPSGSFPSSQTSQPLLQAPVIFFLQLIIPIVDYNEELHGWSKLLNILHIFTLPQFVLFITGNIAVMFFNFLPLSLIVMFISICLSIAVYFTSRNDCPPKYHLIFSAGSFIASVSVIYVVAKEVVSVMKAIGIISDMSDSMVGLSILAWGNSIGDLFSNIALARQGYQQMAFAACFGGPMLSEGKSLLENVRN